MATTLYFVQSDTLPQIKLNLTDEVTDLPKDLTGKIVSLHAKPSTGTGIKFSRQASWPVATEASLRSQGVAFIQWLDGDLNRPAGTYVAEIEIYDPTANPPTRETVYDVFNIVIREDIADIGAPYPASAPTTVPYDGGNGGT
ncbi:MAG: hypothetical protein ACO3UU_03005 [Minisyncoccia bacterium]